MITKTNTLIKLAEKLQLKYAAEGLKLEDYKSKNCSVCGAKTLNSEGKCYMCNVQHCPICGTLSSKNKFEKCRICGGMTPKGAYELNKIHANKILNEMKDRHLVEIKVQQAQQEIYTLSGPKLIKRHIYGWYSSSGDKLWGIPIYELSDEQESKIHNTNIFDRSKDIEIA